MQYLHGHIIGGLRVQTPSEINALGLLRLLSYKPIQPPLPKFVLWLGPKVSENLIISRPRLLIRNFRM